MTTTDNLIHQNARLGLVSRPRLLSLGISDEQIIGRIEQGSLRSIHPGVYATFGRPLDYRARTLAACLAAGPGAVASHRTALSMWGLLDGEQPTVITAPRQSHPVPEGIIVHRPNVLRPVDITTKQHVPLTNPIRSLLDAGVELPRWQVGDCVERALVNRLVTVKALRVILAELGGRGRTGTAALRGHLDRRALGDRRPESMIEPLMARLVYADLGVGPIEYQPTLVLDPRHDATVVNQAGPRLNQIVPVLPVRDLSAALEHYTQLGFETQPYDGTYAFAQWGDVQLHLAVVTDLDPATSNVAVYLYVDHADAHFTRWQQAGVGGRLHAPQDTDYGLREGAHVDPDGNLLRFGSPLSAG